MQHISEENQRNLARETKMNTVALFIDGANMFYAQREQGWYIDYRSVYIKDSKFPRMDSQFIKQRFQQCKFSSEIRIIQHIGWP